MVILLLLMLPVFVNSVLTSLSFQTHLLAPGIFPHGLFIAVPFHHYCGFILTVNCWILPDFGPCVCLPLHAFASNIICNLFEVNLPFCLVVCLNAELIMMICMFMEVLLVIIMTVTFQVTLTVTTTVNWQKLDTNQLVLFQYNNNPLKNPPNNICK